MGRLSTGHLGDLTGIHACRVILGRNVGSYPICMGCQMVNYLREFMLSYMGKNLITMLLLLPFIYDNPFRQQFFPLCFPGTWKYISDIC